MKLIENHQLLESHFKNGMMILPYYHSIIEARLNKQTFAGEDAPKAPLLKQLKSLLFGLRRCKVRKKNIVIFSSTLFNVKKNGRFQNTLHGYYYNLYPNDTLLIEDSDLSYMWRTNDSYENLSFINTYLELLSLLLQKICHIIKPKRCKDYDVFIEEYPSLFSVNQLSKADYYTQIYAFLIKRLLSRIQPKVVLVNCGSFGHNASIICYVAKQMGIKVIEPQHGVTFECPGYAASDFIATSEEYKNYLPDTFFSFGDFWNEYVSWKFEKVSVGNPYLNEYVSGIPNQKIEYDILVISQPMNEQEEIKKEEFVTSLASVHPNLRILFRIHPSENFKQQKEKYEACNNIEVSDSANALYEDICKSKQVLGWFSTCLFECLAFRKMPIIVNTEFTRMSFPNQIGIWINTAEELDVDAVHNTIDYTRIWASGFEIVVKRYIDSIIK